MVELFQQERVAATMAFRGGTAIHKLHLREPARYSEDIDLVQTVQEPIGRSLDAIRAVLDPWLGTPRRDIGELGATLVYRFQSDGPPSVALRLKIEINTREHAPAAVGIEVRPFAVDSRWYRGEAEVRTFESAELLGTKLRALYQRRKGRDLFDIALVMRERMVDPGQVVAAFQRYMAAEGHTVSRAEFEANLAEKLASPDYLEDVPPLVRLSGPWDADRDAGDIRSLLLSRLA